MAAILIIDDDASIRMMFARALEPLGTVETAGSGADALRMLATKKYGVVLLDLHMPVFDGFVVLQMLSTKPGPNRETPVYVVTADTSEHARVKALKHRALFMLTKPVPLGTLTGLVSATLKKSGHPPGISPLEAYGGSAAHRSSSSLPAASPRPAMPTSGAPPSGPAKKPG